MDPDRQLTEYGKWQADVMQHFVKHVGCKMDLVITSDFARGKDTGDYFRPQKARHVILKQLQPDKPAEAAWAAINKAIKPDDQHVLVVGRPQSDFVAPLKKGSRPPNRLIPDLSFASIT
jgi:phosphohistidine phosphatase SixA